MDIGYNQDSEMKVNASSAGVRYLKQIWNISSVKNREVAPAHVDTNIYRVPSRKADIPPRIHGFAQGH